MEKQKTANEVKGEGKSNLCICILCMYIIKARTVS